MRRDPALPNFANYDGQTSRLCDFLGIQTGSTLGNYEALKALLTQQMKARADLVGGDLNSYAVHGQGVLTFKGAAETV